MNKRVCLKRRTSFCLSLIENNVERPYIIDFPVIGASEIGYISVAEHKENIPFVVKRVFWTYGTPESIVRGRHAHYETQQIIVAVAGRILVTTEQVDGSIEIFDLDRPTKGVYIPPNVWHTMQYSLSAVQMVIASTSYDETDYIREYSKFKTEWKRS